MQNSAAPADGIEAAHASLAKHLSNADYHAIGSLFCEHARLLAPNLPVLVGRDNIREFWRQAKAIASMNFHTRGIKQLEIGTIREIGDLRIVLHAEAGRPASELPNKYLFIWQKIGEEWQIESAVWNRLSAGHPLRSRARLGALRAQGPDPESALFVPIVA